MVSALDLIIDRAHVYEWCTHLRAIHAMTIVAEICDLKRFDHPRNLMSFLGLVPCKFSSGASKQRGSITRAGNSRVRKQLIESAWNYRHPAKISRAIEQRLDSLR
jgi:transposase